MFWDSHSPTASAWSTQYMAVLWVHDEEQRRTATTSRDRLTQRLGEAVRTEIRAAQPFWRAEDYHQKYSLRSRRDVAERVRALYDDEQDFVDSTLATRLNAVLGGYRPSDANAWLDSRQLQDAERTVLAEMLGANTRSNATRR